MAHIAAGAARTAWLTWATAVLIGCGDDTEARRQASPIEYEIVDGGLPRVDAASMAASVAPFNATIQRGERSESPADAAPTAPRDAAEPVDEPVVDDDDAGVSPGGCHVLEPGDSLVFSDALTHESASWRRVAVDGECPARELSRSEVHYATYAVCPSSAPRVLDVVMRGADMLPFAGADVLFDPVLAVYRSEQDLHEAPFECLALDDDGDFEGAVSDSARIAGYRIDPSVAVVVVATSFSTADQHGVGRYQLELTARE